MVVEQVKESQRVVDKCIVIKYEFWPLKSGLM